MNGCCVFWPALEYCAHPKAGRNTFWALFTLFSSLWPFFVFFVWKEGKNAKKCIFTNFLKLVDKKKLFIGKCTQKDVQKKSPKTSKKVFQPAFRCTQLPKAGWNTQQMAKRSKRVIGIVKSPSDWKRVIGIVKSPSD